MLVRVSSDHVGCSSCVVTGLRLICRYLVVRQRIARAHAIRDLVSVGHPGVMPGGLNTPSQITYGIGNFSHVCACSELLLFIPISPNLTQFVSPCTGVSCSVSVRWRGVIYNILTKLVAVV